METTHGERRGSAEEYKGKSSAVRTPKKRAWRQKVQTIVIEKGVPAVGKALFRDTVGMETKWRWKMDTASMSTGGEEGYAGRCARETQSPLPDAEKHQQSCC